MTAKDQEFEVPIEEPLLVEEVSDSTSNHSDSVPPAPLPDSPLASPRQIRAATWTGGIVGLCVGGPIGAVALAYGANHFSKKNDGDVGKFCRKVGDFSSKIGGTIKREWNEATSGRSKE